MGDPQGCNMGLRLEITSAARDFSRALSLCFSTISVYTLLVSRRGRASLHQREVSQGSG